MRFVFPDTTIRFFASLVKRFYGSDHRMLTPPSQTRTVACVVCPCLQAPLHRRVQDVDYFECSECGSLFADPAFLQAISSGAVKNYNSSYWQDELNAARERSYGSSLARVAELFFYSRIPIERFIDIGSGPGYLLDAIHGLLPSLQSVFHGVELFPPAPQYRSQHPNYHVGSLGDLDGQFQAGVCVEVIEHLLPETLKMLLSQLATRSSVGAVYYFGSGQPDYVKREDPDYLDPHVRGHIVSYSLHGLKPLFAAAGFQLIPLPGRSWAFLAEYQPDPLLLNATVPNADALLTRLWTMVPANREKLSSGAYGKMMCVMGLESARCYLEHAFHTHATGRH